MKLSNCLMLIGLCFLIAGCNDPEYRVYLHPVTTPRNITIVGMGQEKGSCGNYYVHTLTEEEIKQKTVDMPQLEFICPGYKPYIYPPLSVPMDSINWVMNKSYNEYAADLSTKPIILDKDPTSYVWNKHDPNGK